MLRALVGLMAAMALVPTATTLAAWNDSSAIGGVPNTTVDLRPTVTCSAGLGQATLSWPAGSLPTTHSYTVFRDGDAVQGLMLANGRYSVTLVNLLGTVLSTRTYIVEVRGALPLTPWTGTTTVRVESGLLGAVVSCPTMSYG